MSLDLSKILIVIPARAGSKGVPKKNSKPFAGGKSLVERTIQIAQTVFKSDQIVVSTDDEEILEFTAKTGVIASKRPSELATDHSSMQDVLLYCSEKYGATSEYLLLLQPTCPFRTTDLLHRCVSHFQAGDDAVVGMNEAKSHPDFTLFSQRGEFVEQYGKQSVTRRQDTSSLLEVNGSIYLFKIESLMKGAWTSFNKVRPVITNKFESYDIDTPEDWHMAELIEKSLKNG